MLGGGGSVGEGVSDTRGSGAYDSGTLGRGTDSSGVHKMAVLCCSVVQGDRVGSNGTPGGAGVR